MGQIQSFKQIKEPQYKTNIIPVIIIVGIMVIMMVTMAYAFLKM